MVYNSQMEASRVSSVSPTKSQLVGAQNNLLEVELKDQSKLSLSRNSDISKKQKFKVSKKNLRAFDKVTGGFRDKDFNEDFSVQKTNKFLGGDPSPTA